MLTAELQPPATFEVCERKSAHDIFAALLQRRDSESEEQKFSLVLLQVGSVQYRACSLALVLPFHCCHPFQRRTVAADRPAYSMSHPARPERQQLRRWLRWSCLKRYGVLNNPALSKSLCASMPQHFVHEILSQKLGIDPRAAAMTDSQWTIKVKIVSHLKQIQVSGRSGVHFASLRVA